MENGVELDERSGGDRKAGTSATDGVLPVGSPEPRVGRGAGGRRAGLPPSLSFYRREQEGPAGGGLGLGGGGVTVRPAP